MCSRTFPVGNLRWHILKEHCHNKVTECSLCEQKFVTKNALKNHIKQIHLSETSTCHICHKEYKDLYHHVKVRISIRLVSLHFSLFVFVLTYTYYYITICTLFQYFHEKIRNYECSYCEKKFQAKKLLYNHVQVFILALSALLTIQVGNSAAATSARRCSQLPPPAAAAIGSFQGAIAIG